MVFIDPDNPLAAEILQESGEAYFAACRKMVDSLEELSSFDRELASLVLDDEQIVRRSELLDNAAERVHFVLIQREAMKLSPSETFFEDYEFPPRCKRGWANADVQVHGNIGADPEILSTRTRCIRTLGAPNFSGPS